MFIAWYWLVIMGIVAVGYILHTRRYCAAYRQDRDAMVEGYRKLVQRLKNTPAPGEESAASQNEATADKPS